MRMEMALWLMHNLVEMKKLNKSQQRKIKRCKTNETSSLITITYSLRKSA